MCENWPKQSEEIDLDSDKIYPLGWVFISLAVCAPKGFTNEDIGDIASRNVPPGTSSSRWEVASDKDASAHPNWSKFSGSGTAHAPCPDHPNRQHVLMSIKTSN